MIVIVTAVSLYHEHVLVVIRWGPYMRTFESNFCYIPLM